ncbi:hypothetical protein PV325_008574 [Microctonus aethiopoides]|uniref:Uncharacterized protein n=1 Tax=Microctonus aethiopoides TaxID=144406 RepID=A0AA39FV30_9HYME|nr:hypothetical protein PV325_008574 [Microctonus aethiopoides]KAK0094616.1 hypothetical protein PV326_010452 [Microctonus aethiopoides]KAK0176370.1 hypothetical protein PV328_000514 [Microctonus aethiopoides]
MERKSERSKSNEATKNPKSVSEIDRIIGRIKPSVETRDECGLARHARCLVEISPASPKWLRLHETKKKKIKRKLKKLHKGKKSCLSGELSSDNANNALMMNQDESQYDEICSFDSEINLSGRRTILNGMLDNIVQYFLQELR